MRLCGAACGKVAPHLFYKCITKLLLFVSNFDLNLIFCYKYLDF